MEAGAVQVTVAEALPEVAVPMVGAPAVVGVVTELDWAEAAPGAADVDGGHREGVGGAVGQAGHRLGGGRRVEGLGGLGHAGLVGGDHVAGDGRATVGGRCRPGDGGRADSGRGRADGGRPGRGGRGDRGGWADAAPVPTLLMAATVKV